MNMIYTQEFALMSEWLPRHYLIIVQLSLSFFFEIAAIATTEKKIGCV